MRLLVPLLVAAVVMPAQAAKKKKKAARTVLFFLNPSMPDEDDPKLRPALLPLACARSGDKKLVGGDRCLAGVPRKTSLALLDGGTLRLGSGRGTYCRYGADEVNTGSEDGVGRTLAARDATITGPALGVWPAGAGDLVATPTAAKASAGDEERVAVATGMGLEKVTREGAAIDAYEVDLDGDGTAERLFAVTVGGRRQPSAFAGLIVAPGGDLSKLEIVGPADMGPRERVLLGTSDLDGDKLRELIVYEPWVNGYGLFVIEYGSEKPIYQMNCGMI